MAPSASGERASWEDRGRDASPRYTSSPDQPRSFRTPASFARKTGAAARGKAGDTEDALYVRVSSSSSAGTPNREDGAPITASAPNSPRDVT